MQIVSPVIQFVLIVISALWALLIPIGIAIPDLTVEAIYYRRFATPER